MGVAWRVVRSRREMARVGVRQLRLTSGTSRQPQDSARSQSALGLQTQKNRQSAHAGTQERVLPILLYSGEENVLSVMCSAVSKTQNPLG